MNDVALATGAVVSTTSIPEVYSSWIDALIVVGTSADRNRQCHRHGRHC